MKKLLIVLSILLLVIATVLTSIRLLVTSERTEAYANRILDDPWQIELEEISVNLFSRTVHLTEVIFSEVDEDEKQELISIQAISLRGVGLWTLFNGELSLRELVVDGFEVGPFSHSSGGAEPERAPTELPIEISSLDLRGGTVRFNNRDGRGHLEGVSIRARDLDLTDGGNIWSLLPRSIEVEVDSLTYDFFDLRYRLHLKGVQMDEESGEMTMSSGFLQSRMSEEEFFVSLSHRLDLFDVNFSGMTLQGISLDRLRQDHALSASNLNVDTMQLQITMDKRVPEDPDLDDKPMLTEALQELNYEVHMDSIRFHQADISYSEYDEEGVRPGTIRFSETTASISGVSNRDLEPIHFRVESLLEQEGAFETDIRFEERNGEHTMAVDGKLGRFDLTRLNNILPDLEGVRVDDGVVHSLSFDYTLTGTEARGSLLVHYEDFGISLVDRDNHDQGLGNQVVGFLMDQVVIRSSVGDEDTPAEGEILHERNPEKGTPHYLWASLRSGLLDVVRRL